MLNPYQARNPESDASTKLPRKESLASHSMRYHNIEGEADAMTRPQPVRRRETNEKTSVNIRIDEIVAIVRYVLGDRIDVEQTVVGKERRERLLLRNDGEDPIRIQIDEKRVRIFGLGKDMNEVMRLMQRFCAEREDQA